MGVKINRIYLVRARSAGPYFGKIHSGVEKRKVPKKVALTRHGLILWENYATGSRIISKYLLGLELDFFLGGGGIYKKTPDIPPWRLICYIITYVRVR